MSRLFIILILMTIGQASKGQSFKQQQKQFVLTNIGVNGLIGGIGALINKEKNQKGPAVFLKGFSQGCLGGAVQSIGKNLTYQIGAKQNLWYGWPARITNSIGTSITQNAASNINFWEHWHFNLAFLRLDYSIKNKNLQARVFPSSIFGMIVASSQAKLNLKSSLQSSALIYERDGFVSLLGSQSDGIGIVSSIAYNNRIKGSEYYYGLMAHEMMHIIQYDNLIWINPMLKKQDLKWKSKHNWYNKLSKYIYFDLNGITIYGLYLSQLNQPWECRYLEREADFFSRKRIHASCN